MILLPSMRESRWGRLLKNWHQKADGEASCDYAFHLALSEWNEEISRELEEIVKDDVSSFKMYMTYDNRVDDETIYEVLSRLKELGGIAGVHCENHGIICARQKEVMKKKGNRQRRIRLSWTRPKEAEAEAVGRLLRIAGCVDTPVIIVHLSTAAGYREILRAREAGQTVYVETCPSVSASGRGKVFPAGGGGAPLYGGAASQKEEKSGDTLGKL